MKKSIKITIAATVCIAIFACTIAVCFKYGIEPVIHLEDASTFFVKGNSNKYFLNKVKSEESTLKDKNIIFLGSSVTYGAKSEGCAFPDYIAKRCQCNAIKEAVSGTTLVDNGSTSYISRLKRLNTDKADLLVCQLSTNDAKKQLPLGEVSLSFDKNDFDTQTVAGAMEYIIAYSTEKWKCSVVFFTNPKYDNDNYDKMVSLLLDLQKKWGIYVIDLWNNDDFNDLTEAEAKLYMYDSIHPTRAGYLEWWLPEFIPTLEEASAD